MRFLQLFAMPASSIREWLDHELEVRGIDAVIYTRYILSILQQDNYSLEPQERDLFPSCGKEKEPPPGKGKSKNKQKINKMKFTDCEEMKRSAAVECLMSASEQKCGIEELVDELCSRLKGIQCDVDYSRQLDSSKHVSVVSGAPDPNLIISSAEEQAEKYYAAFPALTLTQKDEKSLISYHGSQCNTAWDGKKLLLVNSKESPESKQDDDIASEYKDEGTAEDIEGEEEEVEEEEVEEEEAEEEKEVGGEKGEENGGEKEVEGNANEEAEQDLNSEAVEVVHSEDKTVTASTWESLAKPCETFAIKPPRDSKTARHTAKLREHHSQHHCCVSHHIPHHGKTLKSIRDHGYGKPSFIVPKCKYSIVKQRVPFFKGKSPFNAPQVKLKRFAALDAKFTPKISEELKCRFSKVEENENYDSSFEDGDLEDAPLKLKTEKCSQESRVVGDGCGSGDRTNHSNASPEDGLKPINGDSAKEIKGDGNDAEQPSVDDQDIIRKLEAKFNENVASIWPKQNTKESPVDKLSEMLESALMTSLSSWFTDLKKYSVQELLPCSSPSAESLLLKAVEASKTFQALPPPKPLDSDLYRDLHEFSKDHLSIKDFGDFYFGSDHNGFISNNNLSQSDAYEDANEGQIGIWQCESEKHNFIKGGVYGFPKYQDQGEEEEEEEDYTLSQTDLYEISKGVLDTTSSPAFDSDVDALLDDRNSTLERTVIRDDDMQLIWEVLGAINTGGAAELIANNGAHESPLLSENADECKLPEESDDILVGAKTNEISIWGQLDHFDVWNMELLPAKRSWDCATFPVNSSQPLATFTDLSVLWDESNVGSETTKDSVPAVFTDRDNAIAATFRWGCTESYHQSLWDIWKDDAKDSHDAKSSAVESSFPNSVNSEEHLSMTRSYDSYLNRDNSDDGSDNLSRIPDQVHLSDPVLFSRKCTLTYHKGESLFVEVKRQKDTLNWDTSKEALSPGVLPSGEATPNCGTKTRSNTNSEKLNICQNVEPTSDDGCDTSEEENLLTSPKTHFRPIRQLSCDSDDTLNSGDTNTDGNQPSKKPHDDSSSDNPINPTRIQVCKELVSSIEKPMFTEDESGILHLNLENAADEKACNHYMIFKGIESNKQKKGVVPAFIPKFKLRSNLEKFCQTDDVEDVPEKCSDCHTEDDEYIGVLLDGNFSSNSRPDVEDDAGRYECDSDDYSPITPPAKDTVLKFFKSLSTYRNVNMTPEDEWEAGTFEGHRYIVSNLEDNIIPNYEMDGQFKNSDRLPDALWSAAEDEEEGCDGRDSSSWPSNIGFSHDHDVDEKDFWAVDEKEHSAAPEELKTMKEEIKEEEAELFEDINQMRELDLHNDWDEDDELHANGMSTLNDLHSESLEWSAVNDPLYQEVTVDCQEDEDCPELEMINGRQEELFSPWWLQQENDDYDGEQDVGDGGSVPTTAVDCGSYRSEKVTISTIASQKFPVLPGSKVLFSSDLEKEWMKSGKPFDIQVPKRSHMKTRSKYQKRPCTFYMDGSCRRTDCKFSHDLASITCRFWEEGSCFKGITCPFLHGYPRNPSPTRIPGKAKQFLLESESDFPSLSKSADSTSSGRWMASALFSKKKKKRNRARHHSSSVVGEDSAKCKLVELRNP